MRVDRSEILSFEEYEPRRGAIRAAAMEEKRVRRVHLGPVLTFLFENAATMRYQVQEMVRAERLRRPEEIQHEVDTYNEVLGGVGELGCSLLVELTDPAERDVKLRAWRGLPDYGAHDALTDAISAAELFLVLRKQLAARTLRDLR